MKIKALISSFALLILSGCQVADLTANDNSTTNAINTSEMNGVSTLQREKQTLDVKEAVAKKKSAQFTELHYVIGTFQKKLNSTPKTKSPNDKELHYVIGTFYMEAGQNDKATESLQKALTPSLPFLEALHLYGLNFDKLSTDKLNSSLALNYKDPNFEKMIQLSTQYFKESISQVESFIKENPSNNQVISLLRPLHRALKNTEKALEYKKRLDAVE